LPKCVACSHLPLTHFVAWQAQTFDLTADDRFTQLSGLSHDPFLRDVFTPLSIGAALVIPEQSTVTSPEALTPWIAELQATFVHLTPPLGRILAAGRSQGVALPSLRYLFWGGDQLRRSLIKDVSGVAPHAAHVNFYGSTETPQAAAFHRVDPWIAGDDVVPI